MNGKLWATAGLSLVSVLSVARVASADIALAKSDDGWELYSSGRLGAFVEVLRGDGKPKPFDPALMMNIHPPGDGGIEGLSDPVQRPDGSFGPGPLFASRVRSGFLGNILAFGIRRQLTERTRLVGHLSIWGTTETDNRRSFLKNLPDEREAYVKIEGPAGSLLIGRALSLFSRGATTLNFLYGHGYAVGNPAGFDNNGPSAGHIGYGVIGSVFVAGVAYATPKLAGLQLTVGYYDPATFVGLYWTRTKFGRPEAELTFDLPFATSGLFHLFVNGAYQKLYASDRPRTTEVYGAGAGGRLEVGPVRLGAAGHYGQGLGVHYFMDGSDAVLNQFRNQELRKFDGAYVQSMLVLGKVDLSLGAGITRVYKLDVDYDEMSRDPATGQPQVSFLKSQMGISGVIVYHLNPHYHLAADYFRADARWWMGERQVVNGFNVGSTLVW